MLGTRGYDDGATGEVDLDVIFLWVALTRAQEREDFKETHLFILHIIVEPVLAGSRFTLSVVLLSTFSNNLKC